MIIGERVKKERLKKGLSQEELGNLLNVSKVSVCGYEKGTRTPTLESFLNLIRILEVDADYLLGRDKNVVLDGEESYSIKLSSEDLEIINELKKHPELYNKIHKDPKRTVELIDIRLKK